MAPVLAGGLVALMLLTGCQGSDDPVAPETSDEPSASASATPTAPSTPEPSPASSLGPAANLPVPVKPALADENTAEGLEAFTEYWFELFSYGYATNDWVPFDAVTDPGCTTCANVKAAVDGVYSEGGWVEGAESTMTAFQVDFRVNTQGSIGSLVEVAQGPSKTYSQAGDVLSNDPAEDPVFNAIFSVYEEGRWIMLDFGAPEGTL
jgi:hypothetical protein